MPSENKLISGIGFTVLTCFLLFQTYIKKDYLNQSVKTVFDYQFERTAYYKKQFGENNVFPVFFDADTLMKKIYFKKYGTAFQCLISSDSAVSFGSRVYYATGKPGRDSLISSVKLFGERVKELKTNYIALSSSTPLYQAITREHFPFLVEDTQTQGIHFQLYSKLPPARDTTAAELYYSDPKHPGSFKYQFNSAKLEKEQLLAIDSTDTFPFSATANYDDVITSEGEYILSSAELDFKRYRGDLELCLVVDNPDHAVVSYNARSASDFVTRPDSTVWIYSDAYIGNYHRKGVPGKKISNYIWNKSKEELRLKDFQVRVIDHWHQKWHFWD